MARIALFTIVSKNYLSYARVLLSSVAAVHPEYRLFLCLVDRVDGYFDPAQEAYQVVEARDIGIPSFLDMTIRYDIMELNTAVKPFMFKWLLENQDFDAAIYLDPDIVVYSRLDKIEGLLEGGSSIVLTPHICKPLEDGKVPSDYNMLQAGVFNLGFMAARKCADALDFINWWGRRLQTLCAAEFHNNLFTDQKWCDLAPCFVDRLAILKDPGFNVAYWNLKHRPVAKAADSSWTVAGRPLVFFHFSGVSANDAGMLSKHQNRFDFDTLPDIRPLFDDYRRRLLAAKWNETRHWPYVYAMLADSVALCPVVSQLYRAHYPEPKDLSPQQIAEDIFRLCNEPEPGIATAEGNPVVTRLMYFIYIKRPDLRAAFNLYDPDGQARFCEWFVTSAEREYRIPRVFIPPFATISIPASTGSEIPAPPELASRVRHPGTVLYRFLVRVDKAVLHAIWMKLPPRYKHLTKREWDKLIAWSLRRASAERQVLHAEVGNNGNPVNRLSAPALIQQLLPDVYISKLMYLIWNARPDLQSAFDLASVDGQKAFVGWFRSAAQREYGVSPNAPIRMEETMASENKIDKLRRSGAPGANLIGYAHAELGMGEHVRMSAAAFSEHKAPFSVLNFNVGVASRQKAGLEHGTLSKDNPHVANIFHINADQMLLAYCHLGDKVFSEKYNIGYWAWELSKCPDVWVPVTEMVDEIWAPSRFIQECFAERTDSPVVYMPLCVTLPKFTRLGKKHFALPSSAFVFLYTFDSFSYFARKNPFDAIRAFKLAFSNGSENVRLVLKTMNGDETSDHWKTLLELIGNDSRIVIINRTMDRAEVLALFEASDCFVSLHRSEGFGRGPAEAMYLGKPVIVTNYSGNTDFTLADNSCLVDYELIPVADGEYPFHQGQVWAQPDVEHAASHMRKVWEDEGFRRTIGARASAYLKENFSAASVGKRYVDRLRELGFMN